jgi:N-acetylglucosaminyldiphosphoundecaprenol N-acetyl-beta-D-mannosaminyltransferase
VSIDTAYRRASDRFRVAGVDIDALTPADLLLLLEDSVVANEKRRVIFCNVSTVVECQSSSSLAEAVNRAEVICPDGMPLAWLGRLNGRNPITRVDGPSMMRAAMEYGVSRNWRHYLYGASEPVLEALVQKLSSDFPGINIAGHESPPYRELTSAEVDEMRGRVNEAAADFVWVGLGMPKQELWMAQHHEHLTSPVLLGVGAAFDFNAGTLSRAPGWMRNNGLEWLYRFRQEPRRLWKRYLVGNARFAAYVANDWVRNRKPRR